MSDTDNDLLAECFERLGWQEQRIRELEAALVAIGVETKDTDLLVYTMVVEALEPPR